MEYRFESDRYLDVQVQLIETQLGGAFFGSWVGAALMALIFHIVDAVPLWGVWFGAYSVYLLAVYMPYRTGWVQRRLSPQGRAATCPPCFSSAVWWRGCRRRPWAFATPAGR